ncbi:PucR family transcriptional regulator [Scopulibacillus cellulosilyticus]|uniref:PucR family transcriptional regulator n=1 Tax=Scopulibacillus cellulosilyticus TaxID=2665665 RepID=A0ABW2Q1D9_9BACL
MKLTVEKILNLDIMKKAKVRTGKDMINNSCVQWISVIEMPVENFVRKNEFVLSTAIGCGHDTELLKQYVQDIIDSEASALVFALGRYLFDIPKEVIELAERRNFIIIELPWEIRFANVIQDVMHELNGLHYKELERSEKIQQRLLKLILEGAELDEIANFVQQNVDCPIAVTDRKGNLKGKSKNSQSFIGTWNDLVSSGVIPSTKPLSSTHDPMLQKIKKVEADQHVMLQLPVIQTSGDAQGYLYVILPADKSKDEFLTQGIVTVLEHAVTTIALWLSRQNAIEETEMRMRSDFIWELAKGDIDTWDHATARAKSLGYNLKVPYVCIVGFPENLKKLFQKRNQDYHSFETWFQNMIRYIEEEILYAVQSLKREVMVTTQEDKLIIFLETPVDKKNENANNFLDLVERRLRHLLPEVVMSWGIGNYHDGILGFKESYQNAQAALDIGRRKKGSGYRMLYDDTRIDRMLLSLADITEMRDMVMATIEPLVHYDEQRSMDLIGTFTAYNRHHGNVSQTSRSLNLHRQSLLYRLRKIESLTGLSLIDPDDLFLLDLCIKIWKVGIAVEV